MFEEQIHTMIENPNQQKIKMYFFTFRGRPTLVAGAAGSGKTLIALDFLVKGATFYNEPGVFMAFEGTSEERTTNVSSLGFDLDGRSLPEKAETQI